VTTKDPHAVQRIPWPITQEQESTEGVDSNHYYDGEEPATPAYDYSLSSQQAEQGQHNKWLGHDTWLLTENDLPWLVDSNGI
jgi:hypothetical protein